MRLAQGVQVSIGASFIIATLFGIMSLFATILERPDVAQVNYLIASFLFLVIGLGLGEILALLERIKKAIAIKKDKEEA